MSVGRFSDEPDDNAALKSEIEAVLAVDPSPNFTARVRVHISQAAAARPRIRAWMIPAGAVAAAAVIAGLLALPPREPAAPAVAHVTLPAAESPSVEATAKPYPTEPERKPVRETVRRAVVREPEILIEPGAADAFNRFAEQVSTGRVDFARIIELQRMTEPQPLEDITPMPIAALEPITIEPLSVAAREE